MFQIITKYMVSLSLFFLMNSALKSLTIEERHQIGAECLNETGLDKNVVINATKGNIPQNNDKYKEFLACSYKKQGYQTETGEILMENIIAFIRSGDDPLKPTDLTPLDECKGYKGPNHGENAFNALMCVYVRLIKNNTNWN